MKKIIFIGAPGSGKGTACNNVANKLNLDVISTGEIFRKIENQDSPIALEIKKLLNQGMLIPDEITNELVKSEIIEHIKNNKGFILDGYPRSLEQAKFLNNICEIDHVIFFDIDHDLLLKRISGRLSCNECKLIYNIYFNPPKQDNICDQCKNILFKRKDDNEKTFTNRLNQYEQKTLPIINFYKSMNKLDTINASKQSNEVADDIVRIINQC